MQRSACIYTYYWLDFSLLLIGFFPVLKVHSEYRINAMHFHCVNKGSNSLPQGFMAARLKSISFLQWMAWFSLDIRLHLWQLERYTDVMWLRDFYFSVREFGAQWLRAASSSVRRNDLCAHGVCCYLT